jgi:hypothetical protein
MLSAFYLMAPLCKYAGKIIRDAMFSDEIPRLYLLVLYFDVLKYCEKIVYVLTQIWKERKLRE